MQIVVLAGGLATRLRPLTEKIPKSMVEVYNKPFLEYQIELLKENGINDLLLCVGYLGNSIQSYFGNGERLGVRIKYSFDGEKPLGTGGALKKAEGLLQDEFFLMYGDSYLMYDYQSILKEFQKHKKLSLLVVYKNENKYDKSNVVIEKGMVKMYDKENKMERMVYIDSGLSILKKEALQLIPENQFFDLADLYQKLAYKGEMLAYQAKQRFYQIGSFEGLKEFENLIKGGFYDRNQNTCQDSFRGWGN
jgi:NDP-sugar pyrophosphorylase family protein